MQITHYSNSFLSISSGSTKLICDPWVGTTYENAWISDPIRFNGDKIVNQLKPNFIYISHLHCDHFDTKLLKKINDKNVVFLIKKFKTPTLKNRIEKLGFKKILELKEWTLNKISEDLTVTIIPQISNNNDDIENFIEYDLDTSILIKCNNTNKIFYNNVDNPLNKKYLKKLKEFSQKKMKANIDVCTFNIGAASEYPQCFLNINRKIEKEKIIKKSMKNTEQKVKILGAKAFFPSGGSYTISGKYFSLNKYVALPSKKALTKLKNKKFNFFDLIGGQTLKMNNKKYIHDKNKLNFNMSKKKIEMIKYAYENESLKLLKEKISFLYFKSLTNYYSRIKKFKIDKKLIINLLIFEKLQLNQSAKINYKKSRLVKKYQLNLPNKGNAYKLDVCLDLKLFYNLLSKKISWNTALSGSLVLFKRNPNKFLPDAPFSLNFLTV